MFHAFNMGIGYTVAVPKEHVGETLELMREIFDWDVQIIGSLVSGERKTINYRSHSVKEPIRIAILEFPGTNCEQETSEAVIPSRHAAVLSQMEHGSKRTR